MPGNLCFYRENDIIHLFFGNYIGFSRCSPASASGVAASEAVLLFDRLMYNDYNILNKTADKEG